METCKSKESLIANNPWKEVVDEMQQCIDGKKWHCDNEFICEGDRDIIEKHNKKCKNEAHRYVIDTIPYAYSGNILNAKIVILSLNPGYIEFVNKTTFDMLKDESKERLYRGRIEDFKFESKLLIASDEDKLIGDRYWYDKLSPLWRDRDNNISEEMVLKNVAIMQYVPYHSTEFTEHKSCGKIEELESVKYNKHILEYLAKDSERIFVLARKFEMWSDILTERGVSEDRIVKLKNYRNTTITKGNMLDTDFNNIIAKISLK